MIFFCVLRACVCVCVCARMCELACVCVCVYLFMLTNIPMQIHLYTCLFIKE